MTNLSRRLFLALMTGGTCVLGAPAMAADGATPSVGTIERIDPRFDEIVPKDARVERIAEGYDWSEGPVWDKATGTLLFSDVPMNTVYQWAAGKGVSVALLEGGDLDLDGVGIWYRGMETGRAGRAALGAGRRGALPDRIWHPRQE